MSSVIRIVGALYDGRGPLVSLGEQRKLDQPDQSSLGPHGDRCFNLASTRMMQFSYQDVGFQGICSFNPQWVFVQIFVDFCDFFKINFSKQSKNKKIMSATRVSNGEDLDRDRRSVGPDLGPNCLQSYQQMAKIRH